MTKLTTSNTSVYNNSTTSVNSLLMNEFNTNRHINHPPQQHNHMKQLKFESQQHHQHSHQLQHNQSMINLPSITTTCIESITDLSRPFKCCHCIKAFKSKALLDQHMHIHYPPKYTCRYCAKKYRWPPVFYHHQRTCKKRPPSTTCTNNDIHNSTITVTASVNTTHNITSNSNPAKRNHHHQQHHNLNYLRSDNRKNFPITSEAFMIPSNIRSQLDDTLYSSFTSIRGSDGNLGGSETFPTYGHKSNLPSFSSDLNLPSNLMELSNNSTMVHNNNNTDNNDDLTLMTPSHLSNFTALAAAAAAAAMSMHFQIPSFSNIPPPPLGFTSSFTSSSTSTTITTSSPATTPFYHHSMITTPSSTSLPSSLSIPSSFSQIHLNCNRSNSLSFTNQPVFQSSHFVPPMLMSNSNEPFNINELSMHSELNFPFNNVLPSGTSILTPTTTSTTTSSSSSLGTINNHHLLDSSTLPYNIMNNLLCICGIRFNEISNYLSHIANCNFLRHLVQQSFSNTFNRSEIPSMPTTITTTSSSSTVSLSSQILSENQQNSNGSSHIQQISSSSSIFPFNTSMLSNEFHYQDDYPLNNKYKNDVDHQEDTHVEQQQLDTLKNSKIITTMISNKMYNSLNEVKLSKIHQDEFIKHEEDVHNEVDHYGSFMNETLRNNNNNEHFNKNPIDLTSVYNLTESQIERNKSPFNSSCLLENNSLSDKPLSINSSNSSIVTAMANVLANAASVAGFQYPELQDLPYRNSKIQHSSPSRTPPLQISTSPTVDIIETDRSDCHSQQNIANNNLDNTNSLSTTSLTTVSSPKSCYQCGKEFSSRLSLKQHVEGKHSTEGKYCCPGCSKRYRWGASYYYHKKSCPAVREQSPVPSDDAVNPLSLCGSDDNSSPSSVNSPDSLSHIKANDDYNMEDRDIEEGEEQEEEKDYDHNDDDDDDKRQKDEKKDEYKCNSSNSLKVRIVQKQYLRSSRNGDLNANSMDDNTSPMHQSKLIKHQIQTKQHCQNIKEDSLICDINAFPLETNS
ncbi:zinc finger protein [Schistosoma japonicum]|uniref:Zinc finger protein n=1 Tax=Schistosoma japonicum TaxID=6182 RepID=A0A4Z2DB33_SCHJA|nr:zinc finger protein [Schistosoma japonicum]